MKRAKRVLAIIATALMVFTSVPSSAFADTDGAGTTTPVPGISVSKNADYLLDVFWNDNNQDNMSKLTRPSMEDQFSKNVVIKFSIDGGEAKELTDDTAKLLGLDSAPSFEYNAQDVNEQLWDSTISLPVEIVETIEKEKPAEPQEPTQEPTQDPAQDPEQGDPAQDPTDPTQTPEPEQPTQPAQPEYEQVKHEVTWTFEYKDVDKYFMDVAEDETTDNKTTVTYTYRTEYEATVKWQDNENLYSSRPDAFDESALLVYRYTDNPNKAELVKDEDGNPVQVTFETSTEAGCVTVKVGDLPAYDAKGNPYSYYTVLDPDLKDAEGASAYDADKQLIGKGDTGTYQILYKNYGDFASDVTYLQQDGTLQLTLNNKTTFEITKEWQGKKDRPTGKFYLYRLAEDSEGKIVKDDIYNASPVQHFDSEDIPGKGEEETSVFVVDFEDESGNKELPMYDSTGRRYVYFALEKISGSSNDYTSSISHEGEAEEYSSSDVIAIFDENNEGSGSKYVLNRGVVTNARTVKKSIAAGKVFDAKAMQNMDATVIMELQYKTVNDEGKEYWQFVRDEDGDIVSVKIDGFSQEYQSKKSASVQVPKYDANGDDPVEYRWVERKVTLTTTSDERSERSIDSNCDDTDIEYSALSFGEIAPGVGDDKTTLILQPTQESNEVIKNTLIAETQVVIDKVWYENGQNVSNDPDKTQTVKFKVTRDGQDFEDNIVELSIADLSDDGKYWEKILKHLPRYAEDGSEYTYDVNEMGIGWTPTYESEKSVVTDDDGNKITQLKTTVINGEGTSGLEFDVNKVWFDDSDLETRKPVYVQVLRLPNGEPASDVFELNEANNWYKRITVTKTADNDNFDNYCVAEVKIGEHGKTIPVNVEDYTNVTKTIENGETVESICTNDSNAYTTIKEDGECNAVHYEYKVFSMVDKATMKASRAQYTIANKRVGVINLDFTKEWRAGGKTPPCEFQVVRSDGKVVSEFKLSVDGVENHSGSTAVFDTSNTGLLSRIITMIRGDDDVQTASVTIENLDKYDGLGELYTYKVIEKGIYNSAGTLIELANSKAQVDGETYVASVKQEDTSLVGHTGHHSGDVYSWKATNTRSSSDVITAYKVWRDDGTKKNLEARPDISFNLYRIAVDEATLSSMGASSDAAATAVTDSTSELAAYVKAHKSDATLVYGDKIWNTKMNDWYWTCEMASLPRYDGYGNKYVYFLEENYKNDPGDYFKLYSNLHDEDVDSIRPNGASTVKDTKEVYGFPNSDFTPEEEGLLIISVGEDNDYARTVVNTREYERTVSGQKIWHLPKNWELPASEKPVIEVDLYRSSVDFYKDKSMTAKKIHDLIASGDSRFVKIDTNNEGETVHATLEYNTLTKTYDYKFKFEALDKYDDFGQMYYYYPYETTDYTNYDASISQDVSNGVYTITNTFNFSDPYAKIVVNKSWTSSCKDGKEALRPAKFELWAQQQIEDPDNPGQYIVDPQNSKEVLMAVGFIDANENEMTELVFDKYTQDKEFAGKKLPYNGANGNPLRYTVREVPADGAHSNGGGYTGSVDAEGATGVDTVVELTNQTTDEDGKTVYSNTSTPAKYKNDYTGGETKVVVQKNWKADANYTQYRKSAIQFTLKRSWAKATVNGKVMPAGSEDVVLTNEHGDTVQMVLNAANNWKWDSDTEVGFKLPKYAPNGNPYTYYIASEEYVENADLMNTFYVGAKDGNNWKNTLRTVTVNVKKDWVNDETGKSISKDDLQKLVDLGMLPQKISFTLKRSIEGGELETVGSAVEVDVTTACNNALIKTWSGLPKYDLNGNEYNYVVEEKVGSLTFITTGAGSGQTGDDQTITSGYAPATPSADVSESMNGDTTVTTRNVNFSNELDLHKYRLMKLWVDNDNFDNTRPKNVVFKVKATNGTKEYKYTLKFDKNSPDGNTWVSDYFYFMNKADSISVSDLDRMISVDEEKVEAYDPQDRHEEYTKDIQSWQEGTDADGNSYFYAEIINALPEPTPLGRNVAIVHSTKNFDNDKWSQLIRPDIYFALYYQPQAGGDYEILTKSKAEELNLIIPGSSYSAVQKITYKDGKGIANWEDCLYEYWENPADPNKPELVKYKIVEVDKNGNEIDQSNYPYTIVDTDSAAKAVDPDRDGYYEASITNKPKNTNVGISKVWVDLSNYNKLRVPVTMQLLSSNIKQDDNGNFIKDYKVDEVRLTSDQITDTWNYTFKDVPEKNIKGETVVYTVREIMPDKIVDKYVSTGPTGDQTAGFVYTNELKPISIDFNKQILINESCAEDTTATKPIEGVKFGLFSEDTSEQIATALSDARGNVHFEVNKIGDYYVQELEVPEGSPCVLDTTKHHFTIADDYSWNGKFKADEDATNPERYSYNDDDVYTIVNDQVRGRVEIFKTSESDETLALEGAVFALCKVVADESGTAKYQVVAKGTTNEEGILAFEGLLTDTQYVIVEDDAPIGHYVSANPIKFVFVNKDGEAVIDTETFDDGNGTAELTADNIRWKDPEIKLSIMKVDTKGKALEGAELQVRDKATGAVVYEFVSSLDPEEVAGFENKLVAGKTYILHEVKAPKGYDRAKDVEFTVPSERVYPNQNKVIKVQMVDKKTPGTKTGDGFNFMFWAMLMVLALLGAGAAVAVPRLRRR